MQRTYIYEGKREKFLVPRRGVGEFRVLSLSLSQLPKRALENILRALTPGAIVCCTIGAQPARARKIIQRHRFDRNVSPPTRARAPPFFTTPLCPALLHVRSGPLSLSLPLSREGGNAKRYSGRPPASPHFPRGHQTATSASLALSVCVCMRASSSVALYR